MSSRRSSARTTRPPLRAGAVFTKLDGVARRLRDIHRESMRESGLTPSQYTVLRALEKRGRASPAQLADACGCTRATMTGILDTLEKHRVVTRHPHPEDRRSLLVSLTSSGRARCRATRDLDRLFGGCCAGLSSSEIELLDRLLTKLAGSLARPSPCRAQAQRRVTP